MRQFMRGACLSPRRRTASLQQFALDVVALEAQAGHERGDQDGQNAADQLTSRQV